MDSLSSGVLPRHRQSAEAFQLFLAKLGHFMKNAVRIVEGRHVPAKLGLLLRP